MSNLDLSQELTMLNSMKQYYLQGHTRTLSFRLKQLSTLKDLIAKYEQEIVEALNKDLGRHELESYSAEIGGVYSSISYTKRHLAKWMKPKKVKTPLHQFGSKSYVISEPYGTALIIGPFNYPFNLCIEPLIGAIAAGNCAVVKPSEQTPNVANIIRKILEEGFNNQYIRVVEGGREEITRLIHSPFDYIFFTGSVPVGRIIMKAASENLVPVTLELGGKSPCIVDKSANLEVAAERIAWGKFFNAGQTCVAPDYLVVHQDIKQQFIELLKSKLTSFYGTNIDESQDLARIVSTRHAKRLANIINTDKQKIVFGGNYDIEKLYIEPTLIDNVDWQDASMQDEIFGPILPMFSYSDINNVIKFINEYDKPLALYFFSENKELQAQVLQQTSAGGCCINDTLSHFTSHYLPFGGVGNSGIGAYHGKYSFDTFSHKKSVLSKSTKIRMKMIFPPYSLKNLSLIKKFLK